MFTTFAHPYKRADNSKGCHREWKKRISLSLPVSARGIGGTFVKAYTLAMRRSKSTSLSDTISPVKNNSQELFRVIREIITPHTLDLNTASPQQSVQILTRLFKEKDELIHGSLAERQSNLLFVPLIQLSPESEQSSSTFRSITPIQTKKKTDDGSRTQLSTKGYSPG